VEVEEVVEVEEEVVVVVEEAVVGAVEAVGATLYVPPHRKVRDLHYSIHN